MFDLGCCGKRNGYWAIFFFFSLSFCYLLWFPENQSWKSFSFFSFAVWLIYMGSCRNRNGYWKKKKKSSFCFFSAFSRQPNRDRLKNSFLVYLFVSLFAGKLRGKNGYRKKKKQVVLFLFRHFLENQTGSEMALSPVPVIITSFGCLWMNRN